MDARPFGPDRLADTARAYHRELDAAIDGALRLLAAKGVSPECREGCAWCCFLPVSATSPEGMLAAGYMTARFPPERLAGMKRKVGEWISWYHDDVGYYIAQGVGMASIYQLYGPGCPMLEEGLCVIYPVRPMGCRVHYSSTPELCQPHGDPPAQPKLIIEILDAVKPVCMDYRANLESMGLDFEKALRPFPELLQEGFDNS